MMLFRAEPEADTIPYVAERKRMPWWTNNEQSLLTKAGIPPHDGLKLWLRAGLIVANSEQPRWNPNSRNQQLIFTEFPFISTIS